MITPVIFLEQTHNVTFMKSGDSNARKKCGLCQTISRALNHITAVPKYHQPKQFNQESKIILNRVKKFQLFFFFKKKEKSLCDSSVRLEGILLLYRHCLKRKQKHNARHKRKCI